MTATFNQTRPIEAVPSIQTREQEVSEGTRLARYCTLEELPGLIFGAVTVGYIVLSLAGLAL
jgi:hypothetical protein